MIEFADGSVPVAVAARIYGKDASWIRAGIIAGWLPIGKATRNGKLITDIEEMNSKFGRINFYISQRNSMKIPVIFGKERKSDVYNNTSRGFRKEQVLD